MNRNIQKKELVVGMVTKIDHSKTSLTAALKALLEKQYFNKEMKDVKKK